MNKLFSERYGYVVNLVQFESLNRVTRAFLWEELYFFYFLEIEVILDKNDDATQYKHAENLLLKIDREIFHNSYLDKPDDLRHIINSCKNAVLNSAWYFVFDLIEFLLHNCRSIFTTKKDYNSVLENFTEKLNEVLKEENAMYRLTSSLIVPITTESELLIISTALEETKNLAAINGHLMKALGFLSNRKNPDYHNSIKESISALESLLGLMISNPKKSFTDAVVTLRACLKMGLRA